MAFRKYKRGATLREAGRGALWRGQRSIKRRPPNLEQPGDFPNFVPFEEQR
jgi:hypothetical protein